MIAWSAAGLFWGCLAAITYVYLFYPALVHLLARAFGRPVGPPAAPGLGGWPRVSLLLAAYNEEATLPERLDNALAADYPADRLEVVVGSDGSLDGTSEVVGQFAGRGVRLLDFADRRGKAAVINRAWPGLAGEVIVLTDANTLFAPDAIGKLARWFTRSEVSCVCGRLVLVDPATGRNDDSLYWRYETFLKLSEGRLGALLGANGAIYALRADRYEPIPDGTIIDDFTIPLLSLLRRGGTIVYEPDAVAIEETAPDVGAEFRRRARIGAGGFQSLALLWPLLDPRRGWLAFAFLSHKVLRWLGPFFLMGMIVANLILAATGLPVWCWVLAAQVAFYAAAALLPPGLPRALRPLRLATMFAGMNAALLVGFCHWAAGRRGGTWAPTARPAGPPAPAGRPR